MINLSGLFSTVNRSSDLFSANERLQMLRDQHQSRRHSQQTPSATEYTQQQAATISSTHEVATAAPTLAMKATQPAADHGQSTSGWLSALRERLSQPTAAPVASPPPPSSSPCVARETLPSNSSDEANPNALDIVHMFPAILTALLKREWTHIGRIWLLARYLDQDNRGWVTIADLRQRLTQKTSTLRTCGWRRLRQLLAAGRDHLWQRDNHDRLWLFGKRRVAQALNVTRVERTQAAIPLHALTSSIGQTRAYFYASIHANRQSAPISRTTLRQLTNVPERTQRIYDDAANVQVNRNYVVGGAHTDTETTQYQNHIWKHQTAAFILTDRRGKLGRPNAQYLAAQLPNSYQTQQQTDSKHQQRRLNRTLATDLVTTGARGNRPDMIDQRYWSSARDMLRERSASADHFWCSTHAGSTRFWFSINSGVETQSADRFDRPMGVK